MRSFFGKVEETGVARKLSDIFDSSLELKQVLHYRQDSFTSIEVVLFRIVEESRVHRDTRR